MALNVYLQPYPTMTDLRSQGHGLGDVLLLDTIKARDLGLKIPGLPPNATVIEAQVYQTLVNLAIMEANLRETYTILSNMILQNRPVICKDLIAHNVMVDNFANLAAKTISKFVLAGLGDKIQRFPQLPPKFQVDRRCNLDPGLVVGGGLGVVVIPPVVWAVGILVVAAGIAGGIVILALKWDDVAESLASTVRGAEIASFGKSRAEVWDTLAKGCKNDTKCIADLAKRMPEDMEGLTKLANSLKPVRADSHGLIWWLGVASVVGLAGAGVYAYKTHKKG